MMATTIKHGNYEESCCPATQIQFTVHNNVAAIIPLSQVLLLNHKPLNQAFFQINYTWVLFVFKFVFVFLLLINVLLFALHMLV